MSAPRASVDRGAAPRLMIVVAEELCEGRSHWRKVLGLVLARAHRYKPPQIGVQIRPGTVAPHADPPVPPAPQIDSLRNQLAFFDPEYEVPLHQKVPVYLSRRVTWRDVDERWLWHFPESEWRRRYGKPRDQTHIDVLRPWSAAVHDVDAARDAAAHGAQLLLFAPVFQPQWKAVPATGIEGLASAVQASDVPVLALGGITPDRVDACLAVGAAGVAVASGIVAAPDIVAAVDAYAEALGIPQR